MTLVCGPPCGGKSWYVTEHAQPGDLVVCVDQLAQQAGSPATHQHAGRHYRAAEDQFWPLCARIGRSRRGTAWIVRCAPSPADRVELAGLVRATAVLVLLPDPALAARRARQRPDPADTMRAIDSWYRRYQPARGDHVIRP